MSVVDAASRTLMLVMLMLGAGNSCAVQPKTSRPDSRELAVQKSDSESNVVDSRVRALESLVARTENDDQAQLVYLASIAFLEWLSAAYPRTHDGTQQAPAASDLSNPRAYIARIADHETTLVVSFVPKDKNVRGGGAEVSLDKTTAEIIRVQPMM